MKLSRGLITGFVVFLMFAGIVSLTYMVPLVLLKKKPAREVNNPKPLSKVETTVGPKDPEPEQDPEPGPSLVIKPFTRKVTSKGEPELEILADEAVIDQKNRHFSLRKIKEIRFFSESGEEVVVSAGLGTWNQQTNKIELSDDVRGKIIRPDEEPINLTCQWMKYDSDKSTLTGGSDVKITMSSYTATAEKLVVKPDIDHLELSNNVITTIDPDVLKDGAFQLDEKVTILADNLVYNGQGEAIQFSGHPVVNSGSSKIESKRILINLQHDNTRVDFRGSTRMTLDLMKDENGKSLEPLSITSDDIRMDMAAGEIRMTGDTVCEQGDRLLQASELISLFVDPDSKKFFGGNAEGMVKFKDNEFAGSAETVSWDPVNGIAVMKQSAELSNNRDVRVVGDQIQLNTNDAFYVVEGNATIFMNEVTAIEATPSPAVNTESSETDGTPSDAQPGEAETEETPIEPEIGEDASGQRSGNLFTRFNSGPDEDRQPMRVNTDRIEVDEREGRMIFQGGVDGEQGGFRFSATNMEVLFDPRTRQIISMSASKDVSMSDADQVLTGGKFHYDAGTGNAEVWENPVMWQGESQIRAERFRYNENTGVLNMIGSVEAVTILPESADLGDLDQGNDDRPADRRIYLTAGNGTYYEMKDSVEFQDDVKMSWGIWKTRSDSLRMDISRDTGELKGADALGNVVIDHESFQAKGHSLTYTPETSILILRGTKENKCQVTQGDRGSQGDEIRFFVEENRFEIEKGMSMIMPSQMNGTLQ